MADKKTVGKDTPAAKTLDDLRAVVMDVSFGYKNLLLKALCDSGGKCALDSLAAVPELATHMTDKRRYFMVLRVNKLLASHRLPWMVHELGGCLELIGGSVEQMFVNRLHRE